MQYMGGKIGLAPKIATYLNRVRKQGQPYWSPFAGALSVDSRIGPGLNLLSDLNQDLVALMHAAYHGWRPPLHVSEEDYQRARDGHGPPHLRAFIGFGCSFGGKYFAGYARSRGQNFALRSARSLALKMARLRAPRFFVADFLSCRLPEALGRPMLIYCDPPYQDTTPYAGLPPFDHQAFWERVRDLERQGHTVIVSEFQAPPDFIQIAAMPKTRDMRHDAEGAMIERLFRYDPLAKRRTMTGPQLSLWEAQAHG